MKYLIGILFMIAGVVGGVYLGVCVMFIGGILGIARAIDMHTITTTLVAINLIKIFLASFVGCAIALAGITIGAVIAEA
ncbi:hypothetical protein G9F71_008880 [Clostridium sp. FP2]|uniref:hypothetical protein n=1 Tax=Clostridium sp. FP2 TaxID=2724481 RepID=UPI0013E98DF4|nr:hypothetical protein [Clostridium sp. FP2]MBZ9622968.1 hypothetical protein [Clostridium sp. FP2]